MDMKYFRIEDVFYTGLIAGEMLNATFYGDRGFRYQNMGLWSHNPCFLHKFIAVHKATPEDIINAWEHTKTQKKCSFISKLFSSWLYYYAQ